SASATMQRARASAARGPNARAASRISRRARSRSPNCATALPRTASAGASSRRATRFSAPSASPAASARAAAAIEASMEIAPDLSLSAKGTAILTYRSESNHARRGTPSSSKELFMTTHAIGTRDAWLTERQALLQAEKELTRRSDELARRRQQLPWVRIEKPYRFDTEAGPATLADLFQGRTQLLIYHFMYGPDYRAGCPSCSSIADSFNGVHVHLAHHDVTLMAVSRAPLEKLLAYRQRMDWS